MLSTLVNVLKFIDGGKGPHLDLDRKKNLVFLFILMRLFCKTFNNFFEK